MKCVGEAVAGEVMVEVLMGEFAFVFEKSLRWFDIKSARARGARADLRRRRLSQSTAEPART